MAAAAAAATPSSVTHAVGSDWGSGHTAAMTVNAGSSALNGWTVEFDSPRRSRTSGTHRSPVMSARTT